MLSVSNVAKHSRYQYCIGLINRIGTAQMTLAFGRHLGEDVTLIGVLALVSAVSRLLKPLGRPTVNFNLGHNKTPH